jgi:hypothetical protein
MTWGFKRMIDPDSGAIWLGWYWRRRCEILWPWNRLARIERRSA